MTDNAKLSTAALSQLDRVDVLNFGSEDSDTTVTADNNFRYLVGDHVLLSPAYEVPFTSGNNTIIDYLYFDVVAHL